jgi:hypothetical protein
MRDGLGSLVTTLIETIFCDRYLIPLLSKLLFICFNSSLSSSYYLMTYLDKPGSSQVTRRLVIELVYLVTSEELLGPARSPMVINLDTLTM